MDYLSLKFLNRGPDLGRNSDERLRVSLYLPHLILLL